jgi:iron complex transport system ATP-binding protein
MILLKKVAAGYLQKDVISDIDLRFEAGEFCAILGPNGAGKSTLLKTIPGFLPSTTGEILINQIPLRKWKRKELARQIALIPQEFQLQFDFSVEELVLMGRFPYTGYSQNYTTKDKAKVEEVLRKLDLLNFGDKMFSQLSGGEKQRVSIARALAQETAIILMDESFSHLDINHQIEIMDLVTTINRQMGKLIILVSHNVNLAAEYCDRMIFMKEGRVLEDGVPEKIVTKETLQRLYGMELEIIYHPRTGQPCLLYPGYEK